MSFVKFSFLCRYKIMFVSENQLQKYEKSSVVEAAMGTIQSIFNSNSHIVRQLPPQISGLYGKSRAGFPLGFGHASSYAGRGVALIG